MLKAEDVVSDEDIKQAKKEAALKSMVTHQYDTVQLYNYIESELHEKYIDEDITEEEYMNAMEKMKAGEELADDVNEMKAEKFENLQQEFIDDEITEEEFEERLDRLFSSGEEFLDVEPDQGPSMQSEAAFRLKEITQIVIAALAVGTFVYVSLMTMFRATMPMLVIGAILYTVYALYLK